MNAEFAPEAALARELEELAQQGLARHRRELSTPCGAYVEVDGRRLLAFASNDYLGLANDARIVAALAEGARQWGAGAGASHLLGGHLHPHQALEEALAALVGLPRALTFSTGFMANLAVLPTLAGRGAEIFADRLNHASLIDAALLAQARGARVHRYRHNDMAALARMLEASTAACKIIVSDAVFSMDGDLAPIAELCALARRHDCWLLLDDAHGFGVLGARGAGTCAHLGIAADARLILMGTLGKAAGVGGAFVAGSDALIETLIHRARSYIFTTAAPPALAAALCVAVKILADEEERRAHLRALIARLKARAAALPWALLPSDTAIQPLMVGDNHAALALSQALWQDGIWAPAIRPPTVPAGTARLRISLSAAHSLDDVDRLMDALARQAAHGHPAQEKRV